MQNINKNDTKRGSDSMKKEELEEEIKRLEADNKELKEYNQKLEEISKDFDPRVVENLQNENKKLKEKLEEKETEVSIANEQETKIEIADIKSGKNHIEVRKNEDDIKWVISILGGMLQGYFGGKNKRLWK
jgi:hypothetical protein